MKRKVQSIRIIAGIILLFLAVCLFAVAYTTWTELTEVGKAEPVNMEVDFSSPGKYSSSFRTTHPVPLGIRLQLKFDGELSEPKPRLTDLDGLEGRICITDNKGQVIVARDFSADSFRMLSLLNEEKRYPTTSLMFPRQRGKDWTISVEITQPATALKNTQQLLTATYLICGLEVMPAGLAVLGGLIFTAIAIKIMRPKHKKLDRLG